MNLQIQFKSYNSPKVRVMYNDTILHDGIMDAECTLLHNTDYNSKLSIELYDKTPADTIVDNGEIVADCAVELCGVKVDEFEIPPAHLYKQEYHTNWPGIDPIISNTLYFGFNGTWYMDVNADADKFYFTLLWESEKRQNYENQQQAVDQHGDIVETFTRFGEQTDIASGKIPSIDELYKLISES